MTKKEWYSVKSGTKILFKTWKPIDGKPVDIILTGEVIRVNSNGSQALVKFNDTESERWFGRLGIDLESKND